MRTDPILFLRAAFLSIAVLAFLQSGPGLAQNDSNQDQCSKKVTAEGFVRGSQSLAELSAIKNWIEIVNADAPERAIWHRAQRPTMKCEALGSQGSMRCVASAVPCAPPEQGAAK